MLQAKTSVEVVGIDPGLDGGIARMTLDRGVVDAIPMPITKTKKGKKTKRDLDATRIANYLSTNRAVIYMCVLEQVHAMPKQGVTSMFSFGMGYGTLIGILAALKIPVTFVPPTTWKKVILVGTDRDKKAAIEYCKVRYAPSHYPGLALIPKGCRTYHDGIADALCLAEYARKQLLPGD